MDIIKDRTTHYNHGTDGHALKPMDTAMETEKYQHREEHERNTRDEQKDQGRTADHHDSAHGMKGDAGRMDRKCEESSF